MARVCVILAALAAAPGFAADITVTASTGAGIMYGLARELVFNTSASGMAYTLSELDWDIKPIFYTKAALALNTSVGFAASLDVRMGVPGKAGFIGDSDWLNYYQYGDYRKTNFSQSDSYMERAILLDVQVGWEIPLANWVSLQPFLSFNFMDLKWTARDGYYQNPSGGPWNPSSHPLFPDYSTEPKLSISGTGIIYQQTYFYPAVGVAVKFMAGDDFGITASFAFSPLVFCNDMDNHLLASEDFYENMAGGVLLEPKVSLEWQVSGRARLSLDVSYRHIEGLVGATSVVITGVNQTPGLVAASYQNGAGAAFDAVDAAVNFLLTL